MRAIDIAPKQVSIISLLQVLSKVNKRPRIKETRLPIGRVLEVAELD